MKNRIANLATISFVIILVSGLTAAHAEEQYQAEITPEYLRSDSDDNFRVIMAGINAEVFFQPVNTADHPYAEAAFLERVGSVFVSWARIDTKDDIFKGDGTFYSGGINLTKPDFPFAVRATYSATKIDYTEPTTGDLKIRDYDVRGGYYFMHALLAGVEYSLEKRNFTLTGFQDISDKTTDYGLFAKYVRELTGGTALNVEAALGTSRFDDGTETLKNTRESLSADYFFDRGLSAGLGIENSSGKDKPKEGRTYSANINSFITPWLSVKVIYQRFLNSNNNEPSDRAVDVALAARF